MAGHDSGQSIGKLDNETLHAAMADQIRNFWKTSNGRSVLALAAANAGLTFETDSPEAEQAKSLIGAINVLANSGNQEDKDIALALGMRMKAVRDEFKKSA